jgi:hypothetical protein
MDTKDNDSDLKIAKPSKPVRRIKTDKSPGMRIDANNIGSYRRRKRRRRLIRAAVTFVLSVGLVLTLYINRHALYNGFTELFNRDDTVDDVSGFPIDLPASAGYDFALTNGGIDLLTDTYFYVYNNNGNQTFSTQHGFSMPVLRSNGARALVFDSNSYECAVYGRNTTYYELTFEGRVLTAVLSPNGGAAVVTASASYPCELYVYDQTGAWKYTRRFTEGYINAVCFADDVYIAAAYISDGDGVLKANFALLRTDSKDDLVFEVPLPDDTLPLDIFMLGSNAAVICDNCVVSVNLEDGSVSGIYRFDESLTGFAANGDTVALILRSEESRTNLLTALDGNAELTGKITINAENVAISSNIVYTLLGEEMIAFTPELTEMSRTALDFDPNKFALAGERAYFLCDETVEYLPLSQ